MNPCENYLRTSFNFLLAFTAEFSDLGQIEKQWSLGVNTLALSPCEVRTSLPFYRLEQEQGGRGRL